MWKGGGKNHKDGVKAVAAMKFKSVQYRTHAIPRSCNSPASSIIATPLHHQNSVFESSSTRSRMYRGEPNHLTNTPLNHHHSFLCIRKPILSTLLLAWILSLRGSLCNFNLPLCTPYDEALVDETLAEKGVWIPNQHDTQDRKKRPTIHIISQIHQQESRVRRS